MSQNFTSEIIILHPVISLLYYLGIYSNQEKDISCTHLHSEFPDRLEGTSTFLRFVPGQNNLCNQLWIRTII